MMSGSKAHFSNMLTSKPILVVAVAAWIWDWIIQANKERRPSLDFSGMTAAGSLYRVVPEQKRPAALQPVFQHIRSVREH